MNPKNRTENCSLCNGSLSIDDNNLCPICASIDTPIMTIISNYLATHRTILVIELVNLTELSYFNILRLLASNKIWTSRELRPYCRLCGCTINISSKRLFCDKCHEKTLKIIFSAKKLGHIKKQSPINVKQVNDSGYIRYGFKLNFNEFKQKPLNECS